MEIIAKNLLSDVRPRPMVTKGIERREERRRIEEIEKSKLKSIEDEKAEAEAIANLEKKLIGSSSSVSGEDEKALRQRKGKSSKAK